MPELRKNIITREWVIMAKERGKRPEDFHKKYEKIEQDKNNIIKNCPFCPGNEVMTPDVILSYSHCETNKKSDWDVKVIPNKFPALLDIDQNKSKKSTEGIYDILNGVGKHEVIIESSEHFTDIPFMEISHLECIISVYYERYIKLMQQSDLEHIIIFRNHGPDAGTSLAHPHSQLIATPVMPRDIFMETNGARLYYEYEQKCPFCHMINFEDQAGERKICENDSFVSINPFFSRYPFETWILPRRHNASFGNINLHEGNDLARIIHETTSKLYKCLKDPSYNLTLNSLVRGEKFAESYHWHFKIIPRITTSAGFELGTGMYINTIAPEDAAKFLIL